jgi:hypothetical protein
VQHDSALTLREVLAMGVEAQCVTGDGTHYFWRGTFGVRIERQGRKAMLLTDPGLLPDVTWFPTSVGLKQLEAAAAAERAGGAKHTRRTA